MTEKIYRISVLGLILMCLGFLATHPLTSREFIKNSDEGYYLAYATTISIDGPSAFPTLVRWYQNIENANFHPPPSRIGFILLSSIFLKFFGPGFTSIGLLSFISFILFIFVSYHYSKKHFNIDVALSFCLFLASSPLLIGLSRRALSESTLNLFQGLTVWLFLDFIINKKRYQYVLLLFIFSFSILLKEASLIVLPFFMIVFSFLKFRQPPFISWKYLFGITVIPIALAGLLTFIFLGGIKNTIYAVETISQILLKSGTYNLYIKMFCSGPWYRYLIDFLILNPIITLLFVGYSFKVLDKKSPDLRIFYLLSYFVYIYTFLCLLQQNKNARFAITLESIMCLFSAIFIYQLFDSSEKKAQYLRIFVVSFGVCCLNLYTFLEIFHRQNLVDPITFSLLKIKSIIPL